MRSRFALASLAVLGGVLLGIGSRVPAAWFLSLASFVPLMMLLARASRTRDAFRWLLLAGACAYGLSFSPLFFDSLPLSWLGISGISGILLIAVVWGVTVSLFAAPFAALLALARRFAGIGALALLAVPSAYVLSGWAGAWLFSIVNYGPAGLLGPDFTMGSPAYQLARDGALLQLAWAGGLYALAFAQAAIGIACYRLIATHARAERVLLGAALALAFLAWVLGTRWFLHDHAPAPGMPLRVALIGIYEPSILAPNEAQTAEKYLKLSRVIGTIATGTADIIAFPEDSRFLSIWHTEPQTAPIPAGEPGAPAYIDSASEREHGTLYSRTEYYDAASNTSQFAYKQFLMPLGEEHPYLYQAVGRLIGQSGVVDTLLSVRGFSTKPMTGPVVLKGVRVAALLCSEGMSPTLYADEARAGAEVFFNLASHTWFHESRAMHAIALSNSKVRAVETRRWYARPADDSPTFILDPYGRVTAQSDWDEESVTEGTLYARDDMTPYVVLGQRVLLIPIAGLAAAALIERRRLQRSLREHTIAGV